jgi:phosphoglycerol transferase MdoB-like AlkP superfamily enzyme
MAKTGLSFTNAYSQGDRTDKGLACIFGGWPGQPWQSILHEPEKAKKLPSLPYFFKRNNYKTSFFYAGDLAFANMNAYLLNAGFENIFDLNSIRTNSSQSKWGYHDEVVFDKFIAEAPNFAEPFFTAILTLSSHEPFDVPGAENKKFSDNYAKFRNAVTYTDAQLKKWMSKAAKQKWFGNTLFVFVADHGRDIGLANMDYRQPAHFKIPIVFWGPALNTQLRGLMNTRFCGQTDIATTLVAEILSEKRSHFQFGRNLLSADKGMAVYFFDNGFGVLSADGHVVWENSPPRVSEKSGKAAADLLKVGKSMQYKLIGDYKNF